MDQIKFDAETHTYTVGDRVVPSVTQILQEVGIIDTRWYTDEARIRGTYVHEAIHLHHNGGLNYDSLDAVIKPYFDAYLKFLKITKFEYIDGEEIVYHEARNYIGTYDLHGRYNNLNTLLDIKTGTSAPKWAGLQTAAYADCLGMPMRKVLLLKVNGWSVISYKDYRDYTVFQSAAAVVNWKRGR